MMRRGASSDELSPARRAVALVLFVVSLGIAAAQRDLQRREDSEVRGNKSIWRLVSLNALGALTYFAWGRA